jgi:hypothetical protein
VDADDSLLTLVRDPVSGRIRELRGAAGCLSQDARRGCRPARGISEIADLTVSGDGRNVYAGDDVEQSLLVFARDPRGGSLLQLKARAGCISSLTRDALAADGILNSCQPRVTALGPVVAFAMAPRDDRLYVTSRRPGRLVTFARRAHR